MLAAGRPGDGVAAFFRYVGTPAEQIATMRREPFWAGMEAIGATLAYDHPGLLGPDAAVPAERAAHVIQPALIMHGDTSYPFMAPTARALAAAIPAAQLRILDGQTHEPRPAVLAPVLAEFFS